MSGPDFRIPDHEVKARLGRLPAASLSALEEALEALSRAPRGAGEGERLPHFLLPMAELGFTAAQMIALAGRVPRELPLDHREIYFDFRLARWMPILEPPTLAQCFEEYLRSAESPAQGMAYLRGEWLRFQERHGAV